MIPVMQQYLHNPSEGIWGDCQRAVLASLLELPLEEVPHFGQIAKENQELFWDEINKYLTSIGYAYMTIASIDLDSIFHRKLKSIYHEIAGPSPRFPNEYHAIVGKDGKPFFDPHPDGTMLAGAPENWSFSFLVKL